MTILNLFKRKQSTELPLSRKEVDNGIIAVDRLLKKHDERRDTDEEEWNDLLLILNLLTKYKILGSVPQ